MPWTINDVDKHKKGLTDKQKESWVKTANSALKSCIADGGTDKVCAPKAIRIANNAVKKMADLKNDDKYSITAMEVFKPGKWNNIAFSLEDLEGIVNTFKELKGELIPKLKLTHKEDQESLAGLASYGDIVDVYIQDDKLFVNVIDVPETVIGFIKEKRFSERSIELWHNFDHNEKTYKWVLSAVSLLGHEIPAVSGLSEVITPFNHSNIQTFNFAMDSQEKIKFVSIEDINSKINTTKQKGGNVMNPEEQIQSLQDKIVAMSAEMATLKASLDSQKDKEEIAKFQTQIFELETKVQEAEAFKETFEKMKKDLSDAEKKANDEITLRINKDAELFVSKLKAEGKITPAVESEVKELFKALSAQEVKISFSKKEGDKNIQVEKSQFEIFSDVFNKLPKVIDTNVYSKSSTGDEMDQTITKTIKFGNVEYEVENADSDIEIKKYMKDNNVPYEIAMQKVLDEKEKNE